MNPEPHLSLIAKTIQLSVAPVFLLTGIGTVLAVLTGRLNRIVDRARILEERLTSVPKNIEAEIRSELSVLSRRAKFVNHALTLGTVGGLLICWVIASMFAGVFLSIDLAADVVAFLFVAAMLAFIGALLAFLGEIFIAVKNLRIGMKQTP
ncbi:MAG TPA: DUF2721 domain-containing protein [Thermodesulfovibrionales bacterium]|jgi:hypothetical protein|nr:DUF2721 domain-containing protein [Thermodesulfovibrionales bacterium]